jgi:SAM-dependent methyltransferase
MSYAVARLRNQNSDANKLYDEDRAIHEWYRFVLSFPPHLVRHYLERFGAHPGHRVLDPFCGTATTLVECKKHGIEGIGIEGNPVAHFAGCVKTAWEVNPGALVIEGQRIAELAREQLLRLGIQDKMPLFPTLPVDIAL